MNINLLLLLLFHWDVKPLNRWDPLLPTQQSLSTHYRPHDRGNIGHGHGHGQDGQLSAGDRGSAVDPDWAYWGSSKHWDADVESDSFHWGKYYCI